MPGCEEPEDLTKRREARDLERTMAALTFFRVNGAGGFRPISAIRFLPISICSWV